MLIMSEKYFFLLFALPHLPRALAQPPSRRGAALHRALPHLGQISATPVAILISNS